MSDPRRPRALFITTDYPPDLGGLETYSHRISRDLPGGLLAYVAVGSDHPGESLPKPSDGAALLAHRGRSRLRAFFWSFRRILHLALTRRVDVLLHMQWSTAFPSYLLRRLGLGAPYVILVHGAELLDPGRNVLNRLKSAILAHADAVVAGSHATAALFRRLGLESRRLEVIHYGNPLDTGSADVTPGAAPGSGVVRLLCMHRLVARKGTAFLLDALSGIRELPWSLQVVGRGEEEASLKRMAQAMGLESRISFRPPVEEASKPGLLDGSDLFILPSLPPEGNNHMEGLGLGLLEAQSRGIAVLGARTGGIPEAIAEERTGLLFEPGNTADLREKLVRLIQDRDLRSSLGLAGPEWVRKGFDWRTNLDALAGLLEEISRKA